MSQPDQIYFSGDYPSWTEALGKSDAYQTEIVLKKVLAATLKIRENEAVEQGVFQGRIPYNFALISALLSAAIRSGNRLSVLDFGGSLGISYFHSRAFLQDVSMLHWGIVELPDFVAAGKEQLRTNELSFYEKVEDCLRDHPPNIIVLSGVLQFLPDPWKTLTSLLGIGAPYVFIDRTALIESSSDRLTIQHVPAWIYRVDKPAWFLSETKLLCRLADAAYECLCDFPTMDNYTLPEVKVSFKGFICRKVGHGH